MDNILVTGCAGFIGFHLTNSLLNQKYNIVGIDNINDYYDVELKFSRLNKLGISKNSVSNNKIISSSNFQNFKFSKLNLEDRTKLKSLFDNYKFKYVIHLAAQAGVRYSIKNPYAYIDSNIYGFMNILELCRHNNVKHLIYASSSSVYGSNKKTPFSENDITINPVSLYAATKSCNELIMQSYSSLYNIKATGLRFFTVYGPWGRPDMAYYKFTRAAFNNESIDVYNHGNLKRDFTYIDDIINGINNLFKKIKNGKLDYRSKSHQIFNFGNNIPISLKDFINEIEISTEKKLNKNYIDMQLGDVNETYADISKSKSELNFSPKIKIHEGIKNFINWYKKYYKIT